MAEMQQYPDSVMALLQRLRQPGDVTQAPGGMPAQGPRPAPPPVVTPGAAQSAPPPPPPAEAESGAAAAGGDRSLLEKLRQTVGDSIAPPATQSDRLAAFAAGIAPSSGNRGIFTQLANGLAAQGRFDAERRKEVAEGAKTESDAEYRRAQLELERRKQEWERDPNNPHAIERLAHARALLAQAARAGSEVRDRVNSTQRDAEGNLYLIHESGRVTRAGGEGGPSFVDPDRSPEARRWLNWSTNREALERGLRTAPMALTETPEQRSARIRRELEDYDKANPRPRAPFDPRPDPNAAPAAERPAPDENQRVIRGNL